MYSADCTEANVTSISPLMSRRLLLRPNAFSEATSLHLQLLIIPDSTVCSHVSSSVGKIGAEWIACGK